jgi:hypothetical protein
MTDILTKAFWTLIALAMIVALLVRDVSLRWFAVLILAVVGSVFVAVNWAILIQYLISRRHASTIPVIGGLLLAIAVARSPNPSIQIWFWLPPLLDPACIPLLAALFWRLAKRSPRQS